MRAVAEAFGSFREVPIAGTRESSTSLVPGI